MGGRQDRQPETATAGLRQHPGAGGRAARGVLEGVLVELLIAAVIGGVVFALVLLKLIWTVVSAAVENGLDWMIHTFGNDRAARQIEDKWRTRGDR